GDAGGVAVVEGDADAAGADVGVGALLASEEDVGAALDEAGVSDGTEVEVEAVDAPVVAVARDHHEVGGKAGVEREAGILARPAVVRRVVPAVVDVAGDGVLAAGDGVEEKIELVEVVLEIAGEREVKHAATDRAPGGVEFAPAVGIGVAEAGLKRLHREKGIPVAGDGAVEGLGGSGRRDTRDRNGGEEGAKPVDSHPGFSPPPSTG